MADVVMRKGVGEGGGGVEFKSCSRSTVKDLDLWQSTLIKACERGENTSSNKLRG